MEQEKTLKQTQPSSCSSKKGRVNLPIPCFFKPGKVSWGTAELNHVVLPVSAVSVSLCWYLEITLNRSGRVCFVRYVCFNYKSAH